MELITIVLIGLCVGSFLNVLIYRLPRRINYVYGRSSCTSCAHKLGVLELIPIVSYVYQKGKCKSCGHAISIQYPLVEMLCSSLLVILYIEFGVTIDSVLMWIIGCIFIVISVIDLYEMIIMDECLVALLVVVLIYISNQGLLLDVDHMLGIFCISVPMIIANVVKESSFGGGDIKLYFICGFLLGKEMIVQSFVITLFLASIVGVIILITKGNKAPKHIAFAPYICIGCFMCM